MGSSVAPKTFPNRTGTFGQSTGDAVTQAQPLAQVDNPGVPSFGAYSQQGQTTPDPTQSPDAGSRQDLLDQLRANRGNRNRPFFGAMS